ncbi:MAG: DUF2344 domain-containing protein [Lachnospiraceae bacterium]|nr:DUF2344 domain-containing protein [Lachnospiraceae bacterium]
MKLRIKFQKTGAIRYIGHLDVMRFFQKCLRRAEIDVCYTTGFSPHQILTFAAPLSVGLESYGEYMDVEVHSATSSAEVVQRLNAASVPEIRIVSAKLLPEGAENAMASVAAARYFVTFVEGRTPAVFCKEDDEIQEALLAFLSKDSIPYVKESKKGTREIDLKAGIFELSWNEEKKGLEMLLDASSGENIKPSQVLDAFLADWDAKLSDNSLCITRLDVYTRKPALENGQPGSLLSMDEVGKEFSF